MTKEDAIDIIKSECYVFNPLNFDRSTMVNTALDMAVKALKQEPCEDAISRKWLKNAIHNFYKGLIHTPTEEDIQAYIDVAPSVTPKPKIGRWIADGTRDKTVPIEDGCPTMSCYCSECGEWLTASDEYSCYGNYCPSCGAKMIESEEV